MKYSLAKKYRLAYEQGFIPIFAADDYPTDILLEGCITAGFTTIEYTLRRKDAKKVIPTLRERFPDTVLLSGSTLDSDKVIDRMKLKFPQLMTIGELNAYGVDGFVSMVGYSAATIKRYCETHLVMVTASTVTEALAQTDAGAHFIKLAGNDLTFVKSCRAAATFDFCPVFVTGGMTLERIPDGVEAGAVLIGSGCEVVLKGIQPNDVTSEIVRDKMLLYKEAVLSARAKKFPRLAGIECLSDTEWFSRLPHYHPFSFNGCE